MECPICKIVEMQRTQVKDNTMYFKCPKCKHEETKKIEEDE